MELPQADEAPPSEVHSSSEELELVSEIESEQEQKQANGNQTELVRASDTVNKSDLFRARMTGVGLYSRFQLLEHKHVTKYTRDFPNREPSAPNQSILEEYFERKQAKQLVTANPPPVVQNTNPKPYLFQRQGSSRCIEIPMPIPSNEKSLQELPKPALKPQRKKEKTRLKNLQKYKNIEICPAPQNMDKLRERAVQMKLEREYGNILKRQKPGESSKFTEEQIKVWLKSDTNKQVSTDKQLALSFINTHVSNYAPLLKVVLTHSFADDLLEPECKKIPTTFADKETYQKIFQFLIFNETIASLHNNYHAYGKSQNCQKPVQAMIKPGSINEDGFFTFTVKECNGDPNEPPQYTIRNLSLSKYNLVIVSSSALFDAQSYSIKDFSKGFLFMGCLLTPENKEQLAADSRMITAVNESAFIRSRGSSWMNAHIFTFEKASTFVREFLAVRGVQFIDLAEFIYNPPLMTRSDPTYVNRPDVFEGFFDRMVPIYNKTQLKSIKQLCLRDRGIIMLQGPPGTGKTSTLLGVLAGQYHYLNRLGQLGSTKILVCTPSNTAIDHIVKRVVMEGLISETNEYVHPRVLRTGLVDTNNETVRSVYLDYLCEKELIEQNKQLAEEVKWTIPQIKDKITDVLKEIRRVEMAMKKGDAKKQLETKHKELMMKKRDLEDRAYLLRRKRVDDKSRYNQIQKRLVNDSEIIFTTLSSAGSERLEKYKGQFACLIVDEAGQCTEPNLLIALQLNIPKVLLIGDPCQLPATTFSPDSNITLFNRSMFERMIDGGLRPYFLDIQYRMTPQIRYFPSKCFYNARLTDDYSVRTRQYPRQIKHFSESNLMFIDVKYSSERRVDKSYENEAEINATRTLIELLRANKLSIGVITPYKQQMRRLQSALRQFDNVFTNTIDSFQGQEKDIVIISCVRASKRCSEKSLGFLIDERRINVALTRSKFLLVVIGNADTLGSNEIWDGFLTHVTKQKQYMRLDGEDHSRAALKRLVYGQLTANDRICEREKYNQLTKDVRKNQRDQIDLGDFVQEGPANISIEDAKPQQTTVMQPLVYEKPDTQPAPAPSRSEDNKWSVEAAGNKDIDRTLNAMYGNKSFFELLREMK